MVFVLFLLLLPPAFLPFFSPRLTPSCSLQRHHSADSPDADLARSYFACMTANGRVGLRTIVPFVELLTWVLHVLSRLGITACIAN